MKSARKFAPREGDGAQPQGGRSSWCPEGVEVSLQEQRGCDKGLTGVAFRLAASQEAYDFFQQKNEIDFIYQGDREQCCVGLRERSRGHRCESRQGRVSNGQ